MPFTTSTEFPSKYPCLRLNSCNTEGDAHTALNASKSLGRNSRALWLKSTHRCTPSQPPSAFTLPNLTSSIRSLLRAAAVRRLCPSPRPPLTSEQSREGPSSTQPLLRRLSGKRPPRAAAEGCRSKQAAQCSALGNGQEENKT